jgi:hypothetical protein
MRKYIMVILCLLTNTALIAQSKLAKNNALILNISQQKDLINYDFGALQTITKTAFKPRIEIGLEHTWKQKKARRFYQDSKVTYVADPYVEKVYGIGTDLGLEFTLFKRLKIGPRLGTHYNLAKAADVQYIYQDNQWIKTKNSIPVNHRLYTKAGFDLGFKINQKIDLMAHVQLSLNSPHVKDIIPLNINKALGMGLRYSL